jgi:hypothetical protein
MRYALAIALALLMGIAELIPATFAAEKERPQTPVPGVTAQYGPGDPGMVAGPTTPWIHVPVVEHDRN